MKYIANPVEVDAAKIESVESIYDLDDRTAAVITLEDGGPFKTFVCGPDMLARMTPKPGDYLVRQSDGYTYLNPKDVFERKYKKAK